ncbi:MAG: hypothetical protein R2844_16995 [Caldilineales bacterium]
MPGVSCQFLGAGHILGSAIVVLDHHRGCEARLTDLLRRLGRPGMAIINDSPETVSRADFLIADYLWRRRHGARRSATDAASVVNETYKKRGKVIIPSFAVRRTPRVGHNLHV